MKQSQNEPGAVSCVRGEPRASYHNWRQQLGNREDALLLVDFSFCQYWLPGSPEIELTAIYCFCDARVLAAVTDHPLIADGSATDVQFQRWIDQHALLSVAECEPLPLMPEAIPKPWGQEVWFTGVEERGVCRFGDEYNSVPIPWLQAILPNASYGAPGQALVLLKILDPRPQPVVGDLYFELHEEKREIYVVTNVDEEAWPDGQGRIRYGFDPRRVAEYDNEAAFRQAYLQAVRDYEQVRRQLDASGEGESEDADLQVRETQLRETMNGFTLMREIGVGDVVVVPLLMPHSLQHGVRTIEFQTPVYERKILSFAQQVLTQDHWDTAEAVAQMRLTPPLEQPFERLEEAEGVLVERIVDFPDFEVRRVFLEGTSQLELTALGHYALVMVIAGVLELEGGQYGAEQAVLLPRHWSGPLLAARSTRQPAQPLVLLVAEPRI